MLRPPPFAAVLLAALALAAPGRPAAAYTPAEGKAPMTVTLVRGDAASCGAGCPEWLALTGVIGPGTPALFSAAVARLGRRNVPVLVDSPGGSVEAAMAVGRVVRARKMAVAVAGTALTDCAPADGACAARRRMGERPGFVAGGLAACASACALILAAGTERSVGEHSYVGVHEMVVHKTLTRVMNYFRIVRRVVNGRPVEVSRTLIGTKPISSSTTTVAAPENFYSEVDRYLLGLGIAESIMPLMRSAPPSGIHWMTPAELAATRIATDTTEAATLVARAAPAGPAAPEHEPLMALATSRLGSAPRAAGIVSWRVSRGGGTPVLAAAVDIPECHMRGTLALRRDEAPGGAGGFVAAVDFGDPAAVEPGRSWTVGAPSLCTASECLPYAIPAAEADDGRGRREFRVRAGWTDGFLARLAGSSSVLIPLTADDGTKGWVSLSLTDGTRATIQDWEHLCCGLAPVEAPAVTTPPPDLRPAPALVRSSGEVQAPFTLLPSPDRGATPLAGSAAVDWTPLTSRGPLGPPASSALLGSVAIPTLGFRMSLDAGAAEGGDAEEVTLAVSLVTDPGRFGPVAGLTIPPVWQGSRVTLLADGVKAFRYGGGFQVALSSTPDLRDGAGLAIELSDRAGRRLAVTLPLDGPLAALLRRARSPASG